MFSRDSLLKAFKWYLSIVFLITGLFLFDLTEDGANIKPLFPALMCFGIVFWSSKLTYGAPKPIFYRTLGVLVVTGGLTYFAFSVLAIPFNFYLVWAAAVFLLGYLYMARAFLKYD